MIDQLKQAKENLERLREELKDEQDLLAIYEPSAIHVVKLLESQPVREDEQEIIS